MSQNINNENITITKTTSSTPTSLSSSNTTVRRHSEPQIEVDNTEPHPNIILKRSDGINHDIITVFKSYSEATDLRQALQYQKLHRQGLERIESGDHIAENSGNNTNNNNTIQEPEPEVTGDIVIPRSDAEHLDLSRAYRSITAPNLMNDINNNNGSICTNKLGIDLRNLQLSTGPIRIVHFSKTLNFLNPFGRHDVLPHGNILIHSGDFTREGKYEEFLRFDNWLHAVSDIYPYRVVILGANDTLKYNENWDQMIKLLPHATHVICDTTELILGLRIHGCPYHKVTHKRKSFIPRMQHGSIYSDLRDIDILISYEPGYGRLDSTDYGASHSGNRDIHDALKLCKPGLHLHGCTAASRGVLFPLGRHPLTINSSMTDPEGKVLYASPHVVKATSLEVNEVGVKTWMFEVDNLYDR